MKYVALIALALVACSKKQDAGPAAPSCDAAAKTAVEAMVQRAKDRLASARLPADIRTKMEERTKKLDEIRPRFVALIANRCTDDKWSPEVVACYSKASSVEQMRDCRGKLPEPLQQKLMSEEMNLMAGAMGPPGLGPAVGSGFAPAMPDRAQIEAHLAFVDKQIADTEAKLAAATSDADRTVARERLEKLRRNADRMRSQLAHATSDAGSGAAGSAGSGS